MEVAVKQDTFPLYFVAVYAIGFMAALIIGSIAWSKSKEMSSSRNVTTPDPDPEVKSEDKSD